MNSQILKGLLLGFVVCSLESIFAGKDKDKKPYLTPQITVCFVIDQFAYSYLEKVKPFLRYGLKRLLYNGVLYHDATVPHAMPTTPTGHAAISTGALPCVHGIVGYGYNDQNNQMTTVVDCPVEKGAVFARAGTYDFGYGPYKLSVDTICDQLALKNRPGKPCMAFAFALKPRSSIMLAGSRGKAFWFDDKQGAMTSSTAYFKELPKWLVKFNEKYAPGNNKKFIWNSFYPKHSKAYRSAINAYQFSDLGKCQIGRKIEINTQESEPWKEFLIMPSADHLLLKTARECIGEFCNVVVNKKCQLLVFVSLSGFDLSAHLLGPESKEQLDKVYHLDKEIGKLMSFAQLMGGTKRTLFVLTSDHGTMPIPEILKARSIATAARIDANEICTRIDDLAKKKFGVNKLIKKFESPQFFFDKVELGKLSTQAQGQLLELARAEVLKTNGIKACWTCAELLKAQDQKCDDYYKSLFAKQTFKGRTGDLVCLTHPYQQLSVYKKGTSHCSPYKYDVHVPLAFYQSKLIDKPKNIYRSVCSTSIAPTLAHLLECQVPSGAVSPVLVELLRE